MNGMTLIYDKIEESLIKIIFWKYRKLEKKKESKERKMKKIEK